MPKRRAIPAFAVESRILILRRQRVILDADLAELYGVTVKRLNQQVTRNQERFPSDFTFQLKSKEHETLRLQFATSKKSHGGRRYPPHAFTEHGAIMAATVLNSVPASTGKRQRPEARPQATAPELRRVGTITDLMLDRGTSSCRNEVASCSIRRWPVS